MSGSSPNALYHPIPQSDEVATPSDIELDRDDDVLRPPIITTSSVPLDTRIRWINFMFGSALLLPWNGAA
jgi:solute carrier family 29 (equilibrative nucleoside transporter), member 1/2/3